LIDLDKIFVDKTFIYSKAKSKKIALFGASEISRKTRLALSGINFEIIFDNSANLWGALEDKIPISNPNTLKKSLKNLFIIISTTSFIEVANQLNELGFKPGKDYVVSPLLRNLMHISKLENLKKKIIFSSGARPVNSQSHGGGIYLLTINGHEFKVEKKISGNSYGIIRFEDNYIAIDNEYGIIEFNDKFKILRKGKLPKNIRPHGVSYSKKYKCFYIACSNIDAILVLDKDFKIKEKIFISEKSKKSKFPIHHINDCLVNKDSIYVSMFSETGNWVNDIFDGAVVEYDILTKKKIGAPIKNLWMPHNITMINNDFHVLDSLRGNLMGNNANILGTFPSFTRGLDFSDNLYFIGQSKNRNFLKTLHVKNNSSIDCGIIVFNNKTKSSRFFQFDPRISEIHSVLKI
jgi:hypothetical protein